MKIQLLSGLCLLSASLTSCQAEPTTTHYLTPIITGQVLDKYTNQPITKANVLYTGNTYTQTDENGYFRLPAITTSDDVSDSAELSEMDISINKKNYEGKTYSNFGIQRVKVVSISEVPEYIHMGELYLEPLPNNVGIESSYKYEQYIEDMPYCQSNESQKEVNCIPLPDGVNHEDA